MDDKFERIDSSYQATTRIGYPNTPNPLEINASLVEDYTCFHKRKQSGTFRISPNFSCLDNNVFTDSLERSVVLPKTIKTVIPARITGQDFLLAHSPERVAGVCSGKSFFNNRLFMNRRIPITKSLYRPNTYDLSEIKKVNPDLIIDIGYIFPNTAEMINNLQKELDIPVVFIDFSFNDIFGVFSALDLLFGANRGALLNQRMINMRQLVSNRIDIDAKRKKVVAFQDQPIRCPFLQAEILSELGAVDISFANFEESEGLIDLYVSSRNSDNSCTPAWFLTFEEHTWKCVNVRGFSIDGSGWYDQSLLMRCTLGYLWLADQLYSDKEKDFDEYINDFCEIFFLND